MRSEPENFKLNLIKTFKRVLSAAAAWIHRVNGETRTELPARCHMKRPMRLAASIFCSVAHEFHCHFRSRKPGNVAWNINDVSILLPLPSDVNANGILLPNSQGQAGELIPENILAMIPPLTPEISAQSQLAVVGVRIDPCFPGVSTTESPAIFKFA